MNVIEEVLCQTSDTESIVDIKELKGFKTPFAFILNYKAHGYAKFVIDEISLTAFETSLHLIKDRLTRKQIYFILYDMIKSGDISGSRFMRIVKNNLE